MSEKATWNDGFAKGLGCRCPKFWWGVLPPPCPLHNPAQATITTTGTNNPAAPAPLDGLREALRPFADFADPTGAVPATLPITQGSSMARGQLTMGDCYKARAALRDEGETPAHTVETVTGTSTPRLP